MLSRCYAPVYVKPSEPLDIREFSVPEDVGPEAILVKMKLAAICGTDVKMWHGKRKGSLPPMIFGHENIGEVSKMGSGIKTDSIGQELNEGDTVTFKGIPCGRCYACTVAKEVMSCENGLFYGFAKMTESPHLFGGYGEYVYLMPGSSVLKIDSQLGEEKAILAVAGGHAVVHGLEKMEGGGFRAGDMVVVQGAGPIGLAGLIQAKVGGAKKIIMIGAPKSRLSIAKEIGADDVIDIEEVPDPDERVELVREMTNENGAELVIEASGGQTALDEGLRMASVGGKYLVIGQSDNQNRAINPSSIIRKQLKIYGTMGGTINNDYKAMQALSKFGALPMDKIITHRFQVEEATDALRCMERLEPMIAVIDHR